MKIRYAPKLKAKARELRKQGVLSEVLLWEQLKGRKMRGYQFMRQKPIGDYIVDFYCSKLKLVIEIDGESHDGGFLHDMERQRVLEAAGLTVLRFNDNDVKKNSENVLMSIEGWVERNEINRTVPPSLTSHPRVKTTHLNETILNETTHLKETTPGTPFIKGEYIA